MRILIDQEHKIATVVDKIAQMYIQHKKPDKIQINIVTAIGCKNMVGEYETYAEAKEVLHAFIIWMLGLGKLGAKAWEELNITEKMFEMPKCPLV